MARISDRQQRINSHRLIADHLRVNGFEDAAQAHERRIDELAVKN